MKKSSFKYCIVDFKVLKDGQIDINNAYVCDDSGKDYQIHHLTEKGYYSKRPIIIDVAYTEYNEEGQPMLIISDKDAESLIERHTGKNGKIWVDLSKPQTTREKVLCDYITDPFCTR
ncbi:hypothetical protein HZQ12_17680 [Elizabethkingia anophelis]|uniref:hypothetical protein n=1 Tax=Elizabethkingia anophelis TaxID=1117645 RepID=UPI0021A36F2D|nr:hypothetical protein [Elizabethkingia anophelis]MCT3978731.1 hypothetical protein [Elizabethkingia anophelis]MCT4042866.1 hypothetical protein [Elizabethkingia anophelis]MDV3674476.1 hypothetical protein [Elizabethkingia anophelis]MDV3684377.1 hypothetical protein [Elizabethkingia anophelis]